MNAADDGDDAARFEEHARAAARSLRREAPERVLTEIRRRGRNVQRMRVAGATATVVAIVALAGVVVGRGGDEHELVGATDPSTAVTETVAPSETNGGAATDAVPPTSSLVTPTIEPTDPTIATAPSTSTIDESVPTTSSVPTSTEPSVSTTTVAVPAPDISTNEWLAAQSAAAATSVDIATDPSTTARLFIPYTDSNRLPETRAVAVEVAPGRLVVVPPDMVTPFFIAYQIRSFGDRIAVVLNPPGGGITILVLDPSTGQWTPGPSLPQFDASQYPDVIAVGGSLVVTSLRFGLEGTVSEQIGAVIRPDLSVSQIALPPAGAFMSFDASAGSKAFLMGWDPFDEQITISQPWSFDVGTGEWSAVPNPDWLECAPDACTWAAAHEAVSPFLAAALGDELVVRTPDGSIGVLASDATTWRRVDDAPVEPSGPDTGTLDDHTLVVVPFTMGSAAGILDVGAGTWRAIPMTTDPQQAWPQFVASEDSLVIGFRNNPPGITGPALVIDRATGEARPPTEADAELWAQHAGGTFDIAELLADS